MQNQTADDCAARAAERRRISPQLNSNPTRAQRSVLRRLRRRSSTAALATFCLVLFAALPGVAETTDTTDTTAPDTQSTDSTAAQDTTPSTEATSSTAAESTTSTVVESTTSTQAPAPETTAASQGSETSDTTAGQASTSTVPSGPSATDTQAQIDAVEAAKEQELRLANLRLSDLNGELSTAQSRVKAQEAEVEIARQELEAAEAIMGSSSGQVEELEAQVAVLEQGLHDQAIRGFMGEDYEVPVLLGDDLNEAVRMQSMLAKATQTDLDYANLLVATKEELLGQRRQAELAAALARQSAEESEATLADLQQEKASQQRLAILANERIDHVLAEQAALEQLGQEAAAGLDVDIDAELIKRLDAIDPPSAPTSTASTNTPGTVSSIDIVEAANGIMVHRDIVDDVRQMLADAEAAGVELRGGGYRDPEGQIRVRKANCGTSYYAIYEMPSRNCSPPTARPGRSMHEQGKAIDFTYNGSIIRYRSGPAWNWLKANASKYGFYNLPSEPWHWSTNGR